MRPVIDAAPPSAPEPTAFSIDLRFQGAAACVWFRGDLDLTSLADAAGAFRLVEGRGPKVIMLDLSELTFIDTGGLRLLLEARKRALRQGRDLVLLRPATSVWRFLDLLGLSSRFEVVDDPAGRPAAGR